MDKKNTNFSKSIAVVHAILTAKVAEKIRQEREACELAGKIILLWE